MIELSQTHDLAIIATDVGRSIGGDGSTFFRGTAISYARGLLAFGASGWAEAQSRLGKDADGLEGEFIAVQWDTRSVRVTRDVFGNASLLHTSGEGYLAISDSMLVLKQLRVAMGSPCSLNHESMLARTIKSSLAGQQISPETAIEQIRFVPAGQGLVASFSADSLKVTNSGPPISQRLDIGRIDYRDSIRQGAANVGRLLSALQQVEGWNTALSLSGGYDSRVVLAGAAAVGAIPNMTFSNWKLSEVHNDDYVVARALAERFGFNLHGVRSATDGGPLAPPTRVQRDYTQFALWGASLMGKYDGIAREMLFRRSEFSLTGIGAELLKGNWKWRTWDEVCNALDVQPAILDAFRRQGVKGLEAIDADPGAQDASELHYLGYRNGLHGSAGHVPVHMTGVHPVQQLGLAALGHATESNVVRRGRGARARATTSDSRRVRDRSRPIGDPRAVNDLAILLSPEVAVEPYDTPGRNLLPSYVDLRLRTLGGRISASEMSTLTLFGDPASVPTGPSELSIALSRDCGYDVELSVENILAVGDAGVDLLEDGFLRTTYAELAENARWRLVTRGQDLISGGSSAAKVASLAALAAA